jgi:hypothetical protein
MIDCLWQLDLYLCPLSTLRLLNCRLLSHCLETYCKDSIAQALLYNPSLVRDH